MSQRQPLGHRIVVGGLAALFQHVMETTPELRQISQAAGYVAPAPQRRNEALVRAIDDVEEAVCDAADDISDQLRRASRKRRRRRGACSEPNPPKRPKPRKPSREAPSDDVIDMEQKPDGTYGAKS